MKSNVCIIDQGGKGLDAILKEVEKVTSYNSLAGKEALRLRLLAEELCGMLPELCKNFDGKFWVQTDGNNYELHVELSVEGMNKEKKQSLIELSASKKNAAAVGFMGKIRDIAENMLIYAEDGATALASYQYLYDCTLDYKYNYAWTLTNYTTKVDKSKSEEWDQLEKSIVAKLADDVIVGVRGSKVDVIIKKEF